MAASSSEALPADAIRPLRRVEYDKLVELGLLEGEHIELLEGALVVMSPPGPPHCATVSRLTNLLVPIFLGRAMVRIQMPVAASDVSEPEPDVAIVPLDEYDTAHPEQAHLLIEVAESSLARDRGLKRRIYAECGVPEYWIVNLAERCIEVYTEPAGRAFRRTQKYEPGQSIRLLRFPDVELEVSKILK
jgi:Uma2 family endonuclease